MQNPSQSVVIMSAPQSSQFKGTPHTYKSKPAQEPARFRLRTDSLVSGTCGNFC